MMKKKKKNENTTVVLGLPVGGVVGASVKEQEQKRHMFCVRDSFC